VVGRFDSIDSVVQSIEDMADDPKAELLRLSILYAIRRNVTYADHRYRYAVKKPAWATAEGSTLLTPMMEQELDEGDNYI
jgi:hypothetical protein